MFLLIAICDPPRQRIKSEGIPRNMVGEIDMAQDSAEIDEEILVLKLKDFFKESSSNMTRIAGIHFRCTTSNGDSNRDRHIRRRGHRLTSLFASQNYEVAADRFERCWDVARDANLREIAALYGWHGEGALSPVFTGEPTARERSLEY